MTLTRIPRLANRQGGLRQRYERLETPSLHGARRAQSKGGGGTKFARSEIRADGEASPWDPKGTKMRFWLIFAQNTTGFISVWRQKGGRNRIPAGRPAAGRTKEFENIVYDLGRGGLFPSRQVQGKIRKSLLAMGGGHLQL